MRFLLCGSTVLFVALQACTSSAPGGDAAGGGAAGMGTGGAGSTVGGAGGAEIRVDSGSSGSPGGHDSGGSNVSGAGGNAGVGGSMGSGGTPGSGGNAGTRDASGAGGSAVGAGGAGTDGSTNGGRNADAGINGGLTITAPWANGAILTGVRDVASPAVTQTLTIHNGGSAAVTLSALALEGTNRAAFQINGPPQLPAMLVAGADLPVTVQVATSGNALPAAPAQNDGGTLLTGSLRVTAGASSSQANLFGLLLTTATHEVTLGQILVTLGYELNVGLAQNNANPNTGTVQQLPKIEAGTDEIAAPLFKKAPAGNATLLPVARFSPKGPMPFGWYPMGNPSTRNQVAEMASMSDAQTSDKARMVLPPVTGSTSFDPGTGAFGVWVYTDQLSQRFDTGGAATNGDYAYSEDAPNSPANVHRTKVYPLKDANGAPVAGSYLLAVEEAGNGDYQDYVFVLSNVTVAQ